MAKRNPAQVAANKRATRRAKYNHRENTLRPGEKWAYYSAKAFERVGGSYYELSDGTTQIITCVCKDRDWVAVHYKWPDVVFVGRATKWQGKAKESGYMRGRW